MRTTVVPVTRLLGKLVIAFGPTQRSIGRLATWWAARTTPLRGVRSRQMKDQPSTVGAAKHLSSTKRRWVKDRLYPDAPANRRAASSLPPMAGLRTSMLEVGGQVLQLPCASGAVRGHPFRRCGRGRKSVRRARPERQRRDRLSADFLGKRVWHVVDQFDAGGLSMRHILGRVPG